MTVFMVPYAYDWVDPVKGTGDGTRKRVNAVLKQWRRMDAGTSLVVLTAGYQKESPKTPVHIDQESLAEQMANCVRLVEPNGPPWGPICHVAPQAWGTLQETAAAIKEIQSMVHNKEEVTVIVASNPFHLYGRVALSWLFLKPRGWKLIFTSAWHRFTWKERLQELFLKIPLYFITVPTARRRGIHTLHET